MAKTPRREDSPAYQRLNQRRIDEAEHEKARARTLARKLAKNADLALRKWLTPTAVRGTGYAPLPGMNRSDDGNPATPPLPPRTSGHEPTLPSNQPSNPYAPNPVPLAPGQPVPEPPPSQPVTKPRKR